MRGVHPNHTGSFNYAYIPVYTAITARKHIRTWRLSHSIRTTRRIPVYDTPRYISANHLHAHVQLKTICVIHTVIGVIRLSKLFTFRFNAGHVCRFKRLGFKKSIAQRVHLYTHLFGPSPPLGLGKTKMLKSILIMHRGYTVLNYGDVWILYSELSWEGKKLIFWFEQQRLKPP